KTKPTVERQQVIMLLNEVVSGGEHADGVFFTDVTLETQNPNLRIFIEESKVVGIQTLITDKVARAIIAGHHQSKRISSFLAGDFNGYVRVDNGARVYRGDRRTENVYALQKEGSLFCKEYRKPLVRSYHQLVCFHLCEVRINCEVECERRTWRKLCGQSRIKFNWLVHNTSWIQASGHCARKDAECIYKLTGLGDREAGYQL